MAKENSGYIGKDSKTGKWFARVTITDARGKRRNIRRTAESQSAARASLRKLIRKIEDEGKSGAADAIKRERVTFEELAAEYRKEKAKPAEYVGERKVSGMRSARSVAYRLDAIVAHFGKMRLRSITPSELAKFKSARLATKTRYGKQRSIAAVNRELEVLRAVLRYAKGEGYIDRSPFEVGSTPIISKADEVRRTRILSDDEEQRLLSVCVGDRRHLRPLIIAALSTGCRKGELFSLSWSDVDLPNRVIRLRAFHTKTAKAREVPITERLAIELERLRIEFPDASLLFPFKYLRHSFTTALRLADIHGLRFHDLRATTASRLISLGLPLEEVSKILGHSVLNTTYAHYTRITQTTVARAAELLNRSVG